MARKVESDIHAILEIALLTDEDQGSTAALVRECLYKVIGDVSDSEIHDHVKWIIEQQIARSGKSEEQLRTEREQREAKKPTHLRSNADEEDAMEDAYWTNRVRRVVAWMKEGM